MKLQQRNIYQLIDSRGSGGIETHVFLLSCWLERNGFNNEVLFLKRYADNLLAEQLSLLGLRWRYLEKPSDLLPIIKQQPSLVTTHGYKAGVLGRSLSYFAGVPVVSTFHAGDLGNGKVRIYSWLDLQTSRLANQNLSVSAEIDKRIPSPSTQVNNFVKEQPLTAKHGKQIAFVGRLSQEKGPESFARITQGISSLHGFHIYGDGPLRSKFTQYPHIKCHGLVNMDAFWKDIGLLCITSESEGLPLVALEAMSRGIPVISYAIGGLPQLITHHKNGWLISPGDEDAYQQAIAEWLLLNTTQQTTLSVAASDHIKQHYTDDVVCPRIVDIYQRALPKVNKQSPHTRHHSL
ncbi:glycosyltransferase family 4 protein [Neptunomonas japonica]|uniref:glycosyltransferase family 4 protein n=1 Tax=Neptunomonas japonica TaxID=417574 RepID=UPI000402A836|nr:glycosyltransferase family 4 protein [Neptunomonas japonica]